MIKKLLVVLMVAYWFATPQVRAIELGDNVTLRGFGTVGLVHSDTRDADFLPNYIFTAKGVGQTESTAYVTDTKAGLQLDWKAMPRLTLTGQVLSKQAWDNTYKPELEWAYAKFAITPSLDLRMGRIRPAIYMLSDYLDVNYANTWVRPPPEFYAVAPITRMEGADLLWRPSFGNVSMLVQPYFGQTKLDLPGSGNNDYLKGRRIEGLNLSASKGDFTMRLGYIQGMLTVRAANLDSGIAGLNFICSTFHDAGACQEADALAPYDRDASFSSIGGTYDNGDYIVSGELGKRSTKMFVSDATSWYVTAGKRIEQWTPYITYASFKNDSAVQFTGGTFAGIPNQLPSTNGIVTQIMRNNPMDEHTVTLGVRYDVMKNVAIKAQWDHVATKTKQGTTGTGKGMFVGSDTFNNNSNNVDLVSVSVDFVF